MSRKVKSFELKVLSDRIKVLCAIQNYFSPASHSKQRQLTQGFMQRWSWKSPKMDTAQPLSA